MTQEESEKQNAQAADKTRKRNAEARRPENLIEKIKKLRLEIEHHSKLYYGKGTPEISDYEFDQLVERLKKLEKRRNTKAPIYRRLQEQLPLADSPVERVGGAHNEGFARVKHLVPMLSLDKIEAADKPTKDEEPDREKRNRLQDQNTVIGELVLNTSNFRKPSDLISKLVNHADPISDYLWMQFSKHAQETLTEAGSGRKPAEKKSTENKKSILIREFNRILSGKAFREIKCFSELDIPEGILKLQSRESKEVQMMGRNRLLLESAFPEEITANGLRAFDEAIKESTGRASVEYVMEPKVDGVSISIHYHYGKLALGVTRGDGKEGDDITANLRTVQTIPKELNLKNAPALLEVRGEAYMASDDFETLNAKLATADEKPFPNARNATAGTLKQLDPKLVAQRPIRAVFYATGELEGIEFKKHSEMLEALARFGLPTQKLWWVCRDLEEVLKIYADKVVAHYHEDRDLRRQLPYEIDGIVLKVNNIADWQRIPTKTRAPGYAIVHKPVPWITPEETVLKTITVQVGRTGVLTPVAELEPVFVQGSTISRATLHNEDEIHRKDIRIGDTVVIRKAGMVIPEIFEVVKTKRPPGAKEFDLFNYVEGKCPVCGARIAREKVSAGDKEEVAWRCQNVAGCPAQQTRRIEYFAQRKALDIESLGGIVAEKLVERGLVKEPLDLFDLKLEQLGKLNLGTDDEPRVFGEKNATKVLEALQRAKTAPLSRWLLALGVPSVGETTAYQIAQIHKDLEEISHSEILKQCLLLYEKVEEAKLLSPDSMINMGPIRKERIAKEKILDSETDAVKRQQLKAEIERLTARENEEWGQRIEQQAKVNSQIEELVTNLQKAGVVLKVNKKEKQKKKDKELAPPILEVTADIELEGARNLLRFFETPVGKKILKHLHTLGIHPTESSSKETQGGATPLAGKTFVLTGTLSTLSRDEASAMIREAGGNVTGAVSKNTNFLLAGEEAGSKLDKAKELGVKILSEKDFMELLGSKPKSNQKKQSELL